MADYYEELFKLCGFEDEEIKEERIRIEKALERLGIGPEDMGTANSWVRQNHDVVHRCRGDLHESRSGDGSVGCGHVPDTRHCLCGEVTGGVDGAHIGSPDEVGGDHVVVNVICSRCELELAINLYENRAWCNDDVVHIPDEDGNVR